MIGETGMVENFDVSLCLSFIRKKRQQERECGFYIQSRRCNVLRLKCEWMWDWCHGSCGWCRRCVNSVGGVYRRLRNAWIVWECVQETKKSQRVTKMALQTNLKVQHQFQRPCWSTSKGCLRWRGALSRHAPSSDVGRPPLVWRWAHWHGQNVLPWNGRPQGCPHRSWLPIGDHSFFRGGCTLSPLRTRPGRLCTWGGTRHWLTRTWTCPGWPPCVLAGQQTVFLGYL